jgi:hypothetical protein
MAQMVHVDPDRSNQGAAPPHDAARAARSCGELLATGCDVADAWRFGILQALDYYASCLKHDGPERARRVFEKEPLVGEPAVDAAFAALAEYLATRDGWEPPAWVHDPARIAPTPWFVAPAARARGFFHDEALQVTPASFSRRNVFLGIGDLDRA